MSNALERAMTATTPHDEQTTHPDQSTTNFDHDREPSDLRPASGVHPGAIAASLAAYCFFIIAAWIVFGRGYAALDLTVVILISVVLLGLFVRCALMSRNVTPDRETERTFGEFVNGKVDTATGEISGRDALVQIAAMPILLTIGGSLIAVIFFVGA
jgi:hypothetical protein